MTSTRSAADTGLPASRPNDPMTFPDLYGVSVIGSCMAPEYPDGCNIKVSKSEPYAKGDVVCVWLRPGLVKPGRATAMIKRVGLMPPPWVKTFPYKESAKSDVLALLMLEANDRPQEWLRVRCADILAIHKVLGILAPEETGPDYRDRPAEQMLEAEVRKTRKAAGRLRRTASPLRVAGGKAVQR